MANTSLEMGPGIGAVAVTPSDTGNIGDSVALYIGTAGTLRVLTANGSDCTFGNVGVGEIRLKCTRVFQTGTTAQNIVAFY